MPRLRWAALLAVLALVGLVQSSTVETKDRTAARLLPPSTVVYAELIEPKRLLDTLWTHPIRQKIEQHAEYQRATSTAEFGQFKLIVGYIEQQIGLPWQQALEAVTAGGVSVGLDAETQGVALLAHGTDAKKLSRVVDTLVRLARDDARNKGNTDPFQPSDYRQVTIYAGGEGRTAVCGPWLVISNKAALMKRIIDNYFDDNSRSLADDAQFAAAQRGDPGAAPRTGWAYLNLKPLRDFNLAPQLFSGKAENPVAELLLGGLLDLLATAPYATAELKFSVDRLSLALAAPYDASAAPAARKYYFGESGRGTAPAALRPRQWLLSLSTHRDLAEFWASAPDLFDDATQTKFEQADSQISPLFSGRDFGREILGALRADLQFVSARQTFDPANAPVPDVKLPAFALVMHLSDPEKIRRPLKASFQSIVGFANVAGAQFGQPQLEISSGKRGAAEIISSTYVPAENEADRAAGKINHNFSPSMAIAGDRFILSSTQPLAEELADLVAGQAAAGDAETAAAERTTNTRLESDLPVLRSVLADNRQQLIAQNMLEKGHSREQAEKEIGMLLELLDLLRKASLELTNTADRLQLELAVDLANGQ